jgi:hypothetical protein
VEKFINNIDVLSIASIPNFMSDEEAEKILASKWSGIRPQCTALVITAIQFNADTGGCQCSCGDASVRNAGVRFDVNPNGGCDGISPPFSDPASACTDEPVPSTPTIVGCEV